MSKKYEKWSPKGSHEGTKMMPSASQRGGKRMPITGSIKRYLLGASWDPLGHHFEGLTRKFLVNA